MPIKARTIRNPAALPPAAAVAAYQPSPAAVLNASQTAPLRRLRGFLAYAAETTDPTALPLDDTVLLLRTPQNAEPMEQAYRNRIKGRLSAIRAFCVLCADGPKNARMCTSVTCPLWSFRMGTNGLRGKRKS